jgi:hypothetical protein
MFKRGSTYSRDEIHTLFYGYPVPRIGSGNWTTGYVKVPKEETGGAFQKDVLIVFMNIGVSGRTGHNFDNAFNPKTNLIEWYGKPKAKSNQPIFKRLLSFSGLLEHNELEKIEPLEPHFFARWDNTDRGFVYLGVGSVIFYKDDVITRQGKTIKCLISCKETAEILNYSNPQDLTMVPISSSEVLTSIAPITNPLERSISSFALEKHLEEYILKNWKYTPFATLYELKEDSQQFPTATGPLDILAYKRDRKGFLAIELKRGSASDAVVGQILRYMAYIKKGIAQNGLEVKGCIIATEKDQGLDHALEMIEDVDFYQYKIDFSLKKID